MKKQDEINRLTKIYESDKKALDEFQKFIDENPSDNQEIINIRRSDLMTLLFNSAASASQLELVRSQPEK